MDTEEEVIDIEQILCDALDRQEFLIHYQPYIDLTTRQVAGVEALIRWQHPLHGLLYPDIFIPHAERSGLIDRIGEWVLGRACAQVTQWHTQGIDIPFLSVNVSPRQFDSPNFIKTVQRILKENSFSAEQLDLEITESVVASDEKIMYATVESLRRLGVRISIDDFGMGYSSLERLRLMQVDRLKIDRIFVSNLALNPKDASLVRSMIHLAQQLGLIVIAEGIEDAEACVRLHSMGCNEGQGFHFSAGLDVPDCERYLREAQNIIRLDACQLSQRDGGYLPVLSVPTQR